MSFLYTVSFHIGLLKKKAHPIGPDLAACAGFKKLEMQPSFAAKISFGYKI